MDTDQPITDEPLDHPEPGPAQSRTDLPLPIRQLRFRARSGLLLDGGRFVWAAGLVLTVSAFTSWYSGDSAEGPTISVTGWNSGSLGKLVFLIGLAVIVLALAREVGVEFPRSAPPALLVLALGALATVFVLIRLISIPPELVATGHRSVGIWISLVAAVAVIAGGLLQAREEL